jgi:hypothetical protein
LRAAIFVLALLAAALAGGAEFFAAHDDFS